MTANLDERSQDKVNVIGDMYMNIYVCVCVCIYMAPSIYIYIYIYIYTYTYAYTYICIYGLFRVNATGLGMLDCHMPYVWRGIGSLCWN